MGLLMNLKPEWWFAAHLHTRFEATVLHGGQPTDAPASNPDEIQIDGDEVFADDVPTKSDVGSSSKNPDEITLEDEEKTADVPPPPPPASSKTKFLALDKCLPRRDFLEVETIQFSFLKSPQLTILKL